MVTINLEPWRARWTGFRIPRASSWVWLPLGVQEVVYAAWLASVLVGVLLLVWWVFPGP